MHSHVQVCCMLYTKLVLQTSTKPLQLLYRLSSLNSSAIQV